MMSDPGPKGENIQTADEMAEWLQDKYGVEAYHIPLTEPLSLANKVTIPIPEIVVFQDDLPDGWELTSACKWGDETQLCIERTSNPQQPSEDK